MISSDRHKSSQKQGILFLLLDTETGLKDELLPQRTWQQASPVLKHTSGSLGFIPKLLEMVFLVLCTILQT